MPLQILSLSLVNLCPVGELMDSNGEMLRLPACARLAKEMKMPLITVDALVRYRECHDAVVVKPPAEKADQVWLAKLATLVEEALRAGPMDTWFGCLIVSKDMPCASALVPSKAGNVPQAAALSQAIAQLEKGDLAPGCARTVYLSAVPEDEASLEAITAADLTRVVHCGLIEPKKGAVSYLVKHGITVAALPEEAQIKEKLRQQMAGWLHRKQTGRPLVYLKTAQSIDGKVACGDGTSQWITQEEARAGGHALRARSNAIIVGSGTALADKPRLNVRLPAPESISPDLFPGSSCPSWPPKPYRVILDARGRVVQVSHPTLDQAVGPTIIFTTVAASQESHKAWGAMGVEVEVVAAGESGGVDVGQVLDKLGQRGMTQVRRSCK